MKSEFDGHNYIVVAKHDNRCKIKPFKTLEKATKYYNKIENKFFKRTHYEWRSVVIVNAMGREINPCLKGVWK